jgi:hypothetical protein
MDKAPKFKYLPEANSDPTKNCPIQILEGKYAGIIFNFGKISLKETNDGELDVTMEVDIIHSPENFDKNETEFTQTAGNIFTEIVVSGVEPEPTDLEDDVHQD